MLMEGKFTIKAPIQKLWETLLDPETLLSCIPGAEKIERIDEKTLDCVVKQKVGPISVKFKFKSVLSKVEPPTHIEVDKGLTLNHNLVDYKRPRAYEAPMTKVLHGITNDPFGPFGAKECSEGAASLLHQPSSMPSTMPPGYGLRKFQQPLEKFGKL